MKGTFYNLFPGFTEEQVNEVVSKLTDIDKEIIKKRFSGERPIDRKIKNRFFRCIVPKIRRRLASPEDFELNEFGNTISTKKYKKHPRKTIYDVFEGYPIEEINSMLLKVDYWEKARIYSGDANDEKVGLYNYVRIPGFYSRLYPKMQAALESPELFILDNNGKIVHKMRDYMTIYETFSDYSIKEVDKMISNLNKRDYQLLTLRFGTDFGNPCMSPKYTINDEKRYRNLLNKMKEHLERQRIIKEEKCLVKVRARTIYDLLFEYSKTEVDEVVLMLDEIDKNILKLKYGEDLNRPQMSSEYTYNDNRGLYGRIIPKMRRLLKKERLRRNLIIKSVISEIMDVYSFEEINLVLKKLTDEERVSLGLNCYEDLRDLDPNSISDSEKWYQVYEFVCFKLEDLIQMIGQLSLTKHDITKVDYVALSKMLTEDSFIKFMNQCGKNVAIIIALTLGCINDKCFTEESIADFLNVEEQYVKKVIDNFFLNYKDRIKEVKSTFQKRLD